MWSSPENPLKESLIDHSPTHILRSTDLLLVPSSELEIVMGGEIWSHVGLVVYRGAEKMVFVDGVFVPLQQWLYRYDGVIVRHCHCVRPMGFDKRVFLVAERIAGTMLTGDIEIQFREGYCVGEVLGKLGLASVSGVARSNIRPHHFSYGTAFTRLELVHYSEHCLI